MPIPLLALGALAQAPQAILGAVQAIKGYRSLKNLSKEQYPEYTISPELQQAYQRAEGMAKQGFSAEETAQFQQGVARQQTGAFRQATDLGGGNLARAISAGLGAQNLQAQGQFAAQGAQLKRQNIQYADELARSIQQQKNLATQEKIQRRQMLEQAYGSAAKTGLENITSSLGGIGASLFEAYNPKKTMTDTNENIITGGEYAGQEQSTPPTTDFDWTTEE